MRDRLSSQQRTVIIQGRPPVPDPKPAGWLARNKDSVSALQSLLAIIALILAIFWFFGQHVSAEKLKLKEHVSSRTVLWNGKAVPMLWIEVWATNVGSTPIRLGPSRLSIDDINPDQESGPRIAIGDFGKYKTGELMSDSDSSLANLAAERRSRPLWDRIRSRAPASWFFTPDRRADLIEPGEMDEVFAGHYFIWSDALTVQITADIQALDGSWWRVMEACDLRQAAKSGDPALTCIGN